ncbi:MAG: leucine-rich repeat protein [Clostridia bacterium]
MSKKRLVQTILLCVVVITIGLLFFACENTTDSNSNNVAIDDYTIQTQHNGNYILNNDGHIDELDLSEITFKIIYENGKSKIVGLDETMLSPEDRNKFEIAGDHTITINYEGQQIPLTISVREGTVVEKFNVMFVSMGGTSVANIYTDVIKTFLDPTKANFTFDGWYDNINFDGERLDVPHKIEKDTTFYAKWIDNRRCNVKFLDIDNSEVYNFDVVYGTSIDPADNGSYKNPTDKPGWIFQDWQLVSGSNYSEITENLVFQAKYTKVKCFVRVDGIDGFENEFDYGDTIDLADYTMTIEEGHTAKWVVYLDESIDYVDINDDSLTFNGTEITINYQQMSFVAKQTIITYEIDAYNGLANQTVANLKSGNILTYKALDEDSLAFNREYNANFNLYITDGKNDLYLQDIYGYSVEWCYVTTDSNGVEILHNQKNQIWNDDTKAFEGELSSNFELCDKDGNKLAQILNGNITEIQGKITIKPKYQKKNYTIKLYRKDNSGLSVVFKQFTVKYYTDFALYDPNLSDYGNTYSAWNEVEDSYLKHTVSDFLTDGVVGADNAWQNAKWQINWFTNPSSTADEYKVNFKNLGTYTVLENVIFYAQDVDTRTYNLTIYYDYDFITNSYLKQTDYANLTKNQPIEKPIDLENSISNNGIEYPYNDLFDYPYEGSNTYQQDNNDIYNEKDNIYYNGIQTYYLKDSEKIFINLDYHNKNTVYYAHYSKCKEYDLYIHDKTQSEAYYFDSDDTNDKYAVEEGTMYYQISEGQTIDDTMLYKGNASNSGSFYYYKQHFINMFNDNVLANYNLVYDKYDGDGGDINAVIANIQILINEKQLIITNYLDLIAKLQTYNYDGVDEAYYNQYFGTDTSAGQYDMNNTYNSRRKEIFELKAELDLINKMDAITAMKDNYVNNYNYYPYSDSQTTLNNVDLGATDYYFAGWYYDSNYTLKADINYDPNDLLKFQLNIKNDTNLYAKWIDKKKGSEGLIFEKIDDGQVVVVGYMNKSQYDKSSFIDEHYSKNVNDQGNMPQSLGENVSLQIPSAHKFVKADGTLELCDVVGIIAGAFDTNSTLIIAITLPSSLKFIEENVFAECNLGEIIYQETVTNYIKVDMDLVLYQNYNNTEFSGKVLHNEHILTNYLGGTLLAFSNQSDIATYDVSSAILDNDVIRIGANAFKGSANLVTFDGGSHLISIGNNAFMGCHDLTTVNLPDTLVTIGEQAFKNCLENFENLNFVGTNLTTVGKDAFANTKWQLNQNGLVIIGNILVGIKLNNAGTSYAKDEFDQNIEVDGCYYITKKEAETEIYRIYVSIASGEIVKIVINKPVIGISDYAFDNYENVNNLASLATIEINATSLTHLDNYVFNLCGGLKVIYFKDATSNITFGESVFAGCGKSISFIFPNGYYTANIENEAAWVDIENGVDILEIITATGMLENYHKKSGEIITLPNYVLGIADNVFASGFENIKQIKLPNNLISIGNSAFANCSLLTSIDIPITVTTIGTNAFANCNSMVSMSIPFVGDGTANNTYFAYLFGGANYNDYAFVPSTLNKVILLNNTNMPNYDIADYAFYYINIKTIEIYDNVISIGNNAFKNNTTLTSIIFPRYLVTIGESAFENCSNLANISFVTYCSVSNIMQNAFKNCIKLENIAFNKCLTHIGFGALEGCTGLKELTLSFIGENFDGSGATHLGYIFGALTYNDNATKIPASLYKLTLQNNQNASGIDLAAHAFYGCLATLTIDLSYVTINYEDPLTFEDPGPHIIR